MTTQAFILLDAGQKAAAELLNDQTATVDALPIVNPLANNLGLGTLQSTTEPLYVLPARVLNDPLYERWVSTLGQLPIHVMDSDTIFIPFIDD